MSLISNLKSPINIFYLSHCLLAKLFLSLASPLLQITPYKPIARYCFADYFPILFDCNLMKYLLLKYKTTGLFVVKLIEKLNSFHFRDFQLRQTARLYSKTPTPASSTRPTPLTIRSSNNGNWPPNHFEPRKSPSPHTNPYCITWPSECL